MTRAAGPIALEMPPRQRPPGFLLNPFGWIREPVVALLQHDPALLVDLVHLTRIRMHLIALALAHVERNVPVELGRILFCGSARDILDAFLGRRPVGLKRIVQFMSYRVLEAESYRRLVQLLDDPSAAKLLYHATEIDDAAIKIIDNIPPKLRSIVFTMQAWFRGMECLADGLHFLVRRGAAESFDVLIADLAHVRQPEQLIAKIISIVEGLPLPNFVPPAKVGPARRIDNAAEIRNLAKRWRNCLENYVWRVNGGECAIYLWENTETQAICLARRRARLGWFLEEVKGPHNAEVEPSHLEAIRNAFDSAGIPPYSIIKGVEDIVDMGGMRGLRRRPRRQILPDEEPDDGLFQDVA
jgi:hypothetical protein